MRRVHNEVEIHCQLKHSAVLEMYSFFEDGEFVYLVLELCHNGEVQQYIRKLGAGVGETQGGRRFLFY